MKNLVSTTAFVALTVLSFSPAALAGGGGSCHFHGNAPAKEAVVVGCAKDQVASLVTKAKIEASWKSAQLEKAEVVDGKSTREWKLTFNNPGAADASKKTLYLFYTLPGNFIAANFTGK
ncbi:MAG: DUF6488 family protein [Polaromonas sp.]